MGWFKWVRNGSASGQSAAALRLVVGFSTTPNRRATAANQIFRLAQPVPLQGLQEDTLPNTWLGTRPEPLQEAHFRAGCATNTLPVPPQQVQEVGLPRTWVWTLPVPLQNAQVSGA